MKTPVKLHGFVAEEHLGEVYSDRRSRVVILIDPGCEMGRSLRVIKESWMSLGSRVVVEIRPED